MPRIQSVNRYIKTDWLIVLQSGFPGCMIYFGTIEANCVRLYS